MKVVLLENIKGRGKIGDIIEIKDGFGRNWLLPQKKALRATKDNLNTFENHKENFEKSNADRKNEAEKLAMSLKDIMIDMVSPAQGNGILYGSITIKDIYDALKAKNVLISKNQINLNKPIKEVGRHLIDIAVHPEVTCEIVLFVSGTKESLHELMNPEENELYEEEPTTAAPAAQ